MTLPKRILSITAAALVVTSLVPAVPVAAADTPFASMLKDIKPGVHGSKPSDLTAIGDTLYFTAADSRHGREPWTSNGTSIGTRILKNISPGSYSSNAADYTLVGERVFFTAQDGNGRELWVTDGTATGTTRVKDIRPGNRSSKPSELTAVGRTLFFTADDGSTGQEVWMSDGTELGTIRVADIEPGDRGSSPSELTAYFDSVYFRVSLHVDGNVDGPCCKALYKSDGTSAGTGPVRDRNGYSILQPSNLRRAASLLYFDALDGSWESRLWRTDGTPTGTKPISPVLDAEQLTDVAGTLFFVATPEYEGETAALWKSDGTKAGTQFIKSVDNPSQLTASGTYLYYTTVDDDLMQPLHVSDGIARTEDSWSAANWANGYAYGNLTDVAGTLFMSFGPNNDPENQVGWAVLYMDCSLYDGDCTQYLWQKRASETSNGSSLIRQVNELTAVGSTLFFAAADADGTTGPELWRYGP